MDEREREPVVASLKHAEADLAGHHDEIVRLELLIEYYQNLLSKLDALVAGKDGG